MEQEYYNSTISSYAMDKNKYIGVCVKIIINDNEYEGLILLCHLKLTNKNRNKLLSGILPEYLQIGQKINVKIIKSSEDLKYIDLIEI